LAPETACPKSQWSTVAISVAFIANLIGFVVHHLHSITYQRCASAADYTELLAKSASFSLLRSAPSTQASSLIANAGAQIVYLLG
jgi:hypothetical protein